MTTLDYVTIAFFVAGVVAAMVCSKTVRSIVKESLVHPLRTSRIAPDGEVMDGTSPKPEV
jgi:hypothetical protein